MGHYSGPSSLCTPKVRAVFECSAVCRSRGPAPGLFFVTLFVSDFHGQDLKVQSCVCVCVCVCVCGRGLQLRISSLLFADDVVLIASSVCDLQHSLDWFTAKCEAAGWRISTCKSEAIVPNREPVDCPL